MLKEDFLNRITEIGSCDDEVQRRELLSQLSEEASKDYDNIATLTETNQSLTDANEKLRDANMKLFLRVGETKDPASKVKDETGIDDKTKTKRSFDNLFNEKGVLK